MARPGILSFQANCVENPTRESRVKLSVVFERILFEDSRWKDRVAAALIGPKGDKLTRSNTPSFRVSEEPASCTVVMEFPNMWAALSGLSRLGWLYLQ